jgi:predicted nucleic acid-binding Zn ribbon protein
MRGDRNRIRLATEALAQVKADAWARGERPAFTERTAAAAAQEAGSRTRRDDPQPLTAAVGGLLSANGWRQRAAVGAMFGNWATIVGPDLAAHTRPEAFDDGELVVSADSTAWATQVRLLAPQLVRRLAQELGAGTVRKVRVRGPAGPQRRGGLRIRGSSVPDDTYG